MTIFKNIKDNRLYKVYICTPMKYTGRWYELEDFISGKITKVDDISNLIAIGIC